MAYIKLNRASFEQRGRELADMPLCGLYYGNTGEFSNRDCPSLSAHTANMIFHDDF